MKEQRTHPLAVPVARAVTGAPRGQRVTALDRWLVRRLARAAGAPPLAFALWDGENAWSPPGGECYGRITFRDRAALWDVIAAPELGFGDGFSAGRIEVSGDLVQVMFRLYRSIESVGATAGKRGLVGRLPRAERNTLERSRRHIQHHYDLGNDFYRLWLDEQMIYTCAYYESPEMTLEQAQLAKMDHVCRKLRLAPGMQVVEAGCGWGTLALHMARRFGVTVRAFNISREQIAWAREQAERQGLGERVEFVEDDYRNMGGRYDAFVSVGMLEHVGPEHYPTLGEVVRRVLRPEGLGLIHSVGRNRPQPPNAWLERRIFPGSYPPSLREMMAIFEPGNFSILDVENLRLHYALTLEEWLRRFDAAVGAVRRMYDEPFVRAWRLYLAGCAAAFRANSIQLFQVVFAHPENNAVPWNRRHLYPPAGAR